MSNFFVACGRCCTTQRHNRMTQPQGSCASCEDTMSVGLAQVSDRLLVTENLLFVATLYPIVPLAQTA